MSQMLTEKRASRGQRMAALVGQAAEDDEAFWNHDIWNEDGSDADSYEEEEEKPDVFDSDFNDTETEEESGSEDEKPAKRAKPTKSANKYQEPQKRVLTAEELQERAEARAQKRLRIAVDFDDSAPSSRTVRESTKAKTADADIARTKKAEQDKLKARPSPKLIKTQFQQRDMLLEALDTEESNKKWLIAQKLEEDERIASEKPAKAAVNESFIRFSSRRGAGNSITFTTVDAFPKILSELPAPEVPNNLCVISGLKARYRDPQTGFPYHDLAAYKELRKLYPAPRPAKR